MDEPIQELANPATIEVTESPPYKYLGTKRCRMCHVRQYDSWQQSPKGRSFEALKPGVDSTVKLRAGLDVQTDYTTDARCLNCHSVGFGRPGGYTIPDPADPRSMRAARSREGVGCEACHGPGSGFVAVMRDISRNNRIYHPNELRAKGRKPVDEGVCLACHNERALCVSGTDNATPGLQHLNRFQVNVADRKGYHEAFPLTRRFDYRAQEVDTQKPSTTATHMRKLSTE